MLQAVTASKKVQNLPLVVSAPLDPAKGTCLVLGVPPVTDRSRKNLLGKAFEQVRQLNLTGVHFIKHQRRLWHFKRSFLAF